MIDILLATYNGSRFLAEALESILKQDFADWRLLIRDGGSQDDTKEIIQSYMQKTPGRIFLSSAGKPSSACENYSALLSASSASYVMFCDQDDVWMPDKISLTLSHMKNEENKTGTAVPLLIFTDMIVVDETLAIVNNSFFTYQNLNPSYVSLNRLLAQNVISGCTVMVNRELINRCGMIPSSAIMHDYWLALTAAVFGKILYINKPTLLYRQHEKNCVGASKYGLGYFADRLCSGMSPIRSQFYRNTVQAQDFLEQYRGVLNDIDRQVLESFAKLRVFNWFKRRRILWQNKIFKTGLLRNVGMFLIA